MENLYIPELARVVGIKDETPNIRSLMVALQNPRHFASLPGQFVEFTVFGYGEFPVSLAHNLDPQTGRFKVTIQRAGKVTRKIYALKQGDQVGVRGPFGNGYPLQLMTGHNVVLVAGGVGLAAVWDLVNHLLDHQERFGELSLFCGARSPEDMIYQEQLSQMQHAVPGMAVHLIVDHVNQDWSGSEGFVSHLLQAQRPAPDNTVVVLCGPGPMMKATLEVLATLGFGPHQVYLSLERRMQCGMGACGHCMIGSQRVCLDGPVFAQAELPANFWNHK